MATIQCEIVSAERKLLSVEASQVSARSLEGELGILPGHQPLLIALQDAPVRIALAGGGAEHVAVHNGFLYFQDNHLVVLADLAELSSDIDMARAQARLDERQAELDRGGAEDATVQASIRRQKVRISVGTL